MLGITSILPHHFVRLQLIHDDLILCKCIIFSTGVYGVWYPFPDKFYIVVPQWYQYCLGVDVANNLLNFTINGNITVATNKE
jgi:hypothetical protein